MCLNCHDSVVTLPLLAHLQCAPADRKQHETTIQRADYLFGQHSTLQTQLQAGKHNLSVDDSNSTEMSDRWRLQVEEIKVG
jgi:hypothetical protein